MNKVIKVDKDKIDKLINYYEPFMRDKKPPYSVFQAKDGDTVVTLYESGKVMFQGPTADIDAAFWGEAILIEKESFTFNTEDSIGSDEVGTGDYFGPIVVVAAMIKEENKDKLMELGIKDSKALTDEHILKISPKLKGLCDYSYFILNNKVYNEYNEKGYNMNKLKALMHNDCLLKMHNKYPEIKKIIIDEFTTKERFYDYIADETNKIDNLTSLTKGESKSLAVATASVIARYIFLKEMDKLSDKVHYPLPKGAGPQVDSAGKDLVKEHGKEILKEIAKYNFGNTKKILDIYI